MVALDAAVEDADADAGAGRALDRPGAVDLLRQRVRERDLRGRLARQRPRREKLCSSLMPTSAARRARRARSSSSPTARLISTRCAAARAAPPASACRGLEVRPERRVDALGEGTGEDRTSAHASAIASGAAAARSSTLPNAKSRRGSEASGSRVGERCAGGGERLRVLLGEPRRAAWPAPLPGRAGRIAGVARSAATRPRPPPHPPAQWRARRRPVFRCEGPPPLGGAQPFADVGEHAAVSARSRRLRGWTRGRRGASPAARRRLRRGRGGRRAHASPAAAPAPRAPSPRASGEAPRSGGRALRCRRRHFSSHPTSGLTRASESSIAPFNFSRQREMRLAIVPAGRSSSSPIVR